MSKYEPLSHEWQQNEARKGGELLGGILLVLLPLWLIWKVLKFVFGVFPVMAELGASTSMLMVLGIIVMVTGSIIFGVGQGGSGGYLSILVGGAIFMVPLIRKQREEL